MKFEIPELETPRLRMRAFRPEDVASEQAFYRTDRSRFVGGPQPEYATFRALAGIIGHWVLRGYGFWALEEKASGRYAGRVGLWNPEPWPEPEIGWTLMDGFEGRGLATEAALAARVFAYGRLGWTTAISLIDENNIGSQGVAMRLGCERDGQFRHPEGWQAEVWRHPAPAEAAA